MIAQRTTPIPPDSRALLGMANGLTVATVYGRERQTTTTEGGTLWEYDTSSFTFQDGLHLHAREVQANPEAFLGYSGDVDHLYASALETVQTWRNKREATPARITFPGLDFPVEYSPTAVQMATALMVSMSAGMRSTFNWTDATNQRHENLTMDHLKLIAAALDAYISRYQDTADEARQAIFAAASNEEVAAALQILNH